MAEVRLAKAAEADLGRLIEFLALPGDTRLRVKRSLFVLGEFPLIGRALHGRWRPLRFIVGPWSWMLLVYTYDEPSDVVTVVTIQDARSAVASTGTN